jgi:hypothetical protein
VSNGRIRGHAAVLLAPVAIGIEETEPWNHDRDSQAGETEDD